MPVVTPGIPVGPGAWAYLGPAPLERDRRTQASEPEFAPPMLSTSGAEHSVPAPEHRSCAHPRTRCRASYNACAGLILPYRPFRNYLAQAGYAALTWCCPPRRVVAAAPPRAPPQPLFLTVYSTVNGTVRALTALRQLQRKWIYFHGPAFA